VNKRRSIVLYLPNLAGGGVERILLLMAPGFIRAGYDVTFLLHSADGELIENVPSGVRVVSLNKHRTILALIPLIRYLRKERPAILFSCLGHNNIVAIWAGLLSRTGIPVIIGQHNALSAETVKGKGLKFSKLLPILYHFFLRYAAGVVAVSQGVADDIAKVASVSREWITLIYNPIVEQTFDQKLNEPCLHPWLKEGGGPVLVGVGRFVEQKDFATLLAAFSQVVKKKDVRLILVGYGPLSDALKAQTCALGLESRVDFPGYQANPLPFMRRAALFVMSSSNEGFGNVLVEAMACGTPVVSTDCNYGPSEILENGRYGKLVPVGDSDALAEAILSTFNTPPDIDAIRARGREFTVEKAVNQYVALFDKVCAKKR
jgi:glycosyltransferase involved in cell wall biosynthesis